MLKIYKVIFTLFILTCSTLARESIDLSKDLNHITTKYLQLLKEQSKVTCAPGDYERAGKLYSEYVGNGLYIPINDQDIIESQTIKKYIPVLAKKRDWIKEEISKLSKKKHLKKEYREIVSLQKDFEKLHQQYYLQYQGKKNNLKVSFVKFNKKLESFIERTTFLHSFDFPVDYFKLRQSYDELLETNNGPLMRETYFKRKIYEDGAISPQNRRKDLFLRSLISTVYIRLKNVSGKFYDEDLRYDIESLLEMYKTTILRKKSFHLKALRLWRKKTQEDINFYFRMIKAKSDSSFLKNIGATKKRARKKLKDYTYHREALVYKFWSEQEKIYRILHVLESILFHEVGPLDNNFGSERMSIIQVVLNRLRNPMYNSISDDEDLAQYIKSVGIKDTSKFPWLNVLFKKGQFSFTYFFIPASRGIFCPDGSRFAKKLRKRNIELSLRGIKYPLNVFTPTRYFSRASMTGRIDMAKLWRGYEKWPQLSGPLIENDSKLRKMKKTGKLLFTGSFKSTKNSYEVWKSKKKYYLYDKKSDQFNVYRNPHLFTYFFKQKGYQ